MIEKLGLPFPMLSDPDRDRAIGPYDLIDDHDPRGLAIPATVLLAPGGDEVFRHVSADYAERITEDAVVDRVRALGLPPTTQPSPTLGPVEAGRRAMPLESMVPYFRGARFAVVALSGRHDLGGDAAEYVAQMDRYVEATVARFRAVRAAGQE